MFFITGDDIVWVTIRPMTRELDEYLSFLLNQKGLE